MFTKIPMLEDLTNEELLELARAKFANSPHNGSSYDLLTSVQTIAQLKGSRQAIIAYLMAGEEK